MIRKRDGEKSHCDCKLCSPEASEEIEECKKKETSRGQKEKIGTPLEQFVDHKSQVYFGGDNACNPNIILDFCTRGLRVSDRDVLPRAFCQHEHGVRGCCAPRGRDDSPTFSFSPACSLTVTNPSISRQPDSLANS